jgi:hypothetical protein
MKMKNKILIILLSLFATGAILSSCGSRKNSCDCPKNVTDKRNKAPKAHKNNIYKK